MKPAKIRLIQQPQGVHSAFAVAIGIASEAWKTTVKQHAVVPNGRNCEGGGFTTSITWLCGRDRMIYAVCVYIYICIIIYIYIYHKYI